MRISKKILAAFLSVLFVATAFAGCSGNNGGTDPANDSAGVAVSDLKIGVIEIGDDQETYTKAHSDGIRAAAEELGVSLDNIIFKTKIPEDNQCVVAADQLAAEGCQLIISNSYGHQDPITEAAQKYPNITFVAMTGDFASISGVPNLYNAFTKVFEARYVSGVVAGMKVKELVDAGKLSDSNYKDGKVKIGYVGAFPYAEVVSGYSAFFLGIQSVYPDVVMDVQYTSSWFDLEGEAAAAELLIDRGCVIIGQHADSTGAPAAVEAANNAGKPVYSVGYNVDMIPTAPTAALTSPTNNWAEYYKELFSAVINGTEIPQNWAKGFDANAVGITDLGVSCAEGTQEAVDAAIAGIKDGTVKVFDTSKFTVDGATLTTSPVDLSYYDFSTDPATVVYQGETKEGIITADGISYFDESTLRSAPYFTIRIDGITELNAG